MTPLDRRDENGFLNFRKASPYVRERGRWIVAGSAAFVAFGFVAVVAAVMGMF